MPHDEDQRTDAEGTGDVVRRVGPPTAAAIAALIVLTVLAGLAITRGPLDAVDRLDQRAVEALVERRTPAVSTLTRGLTFLADSTTVAALWALAVGVAAWRTRRALLPAFLIVTIGGEKLSYLLASLIVSRPRPSVPTLGHTFAPNSFPSGHIGSVLVLYGGVLIAARHVARRTGRPAALAGERPPAAAVALGALVGLLAVGVGFSRMYRGHHFPSDVVWGALLGVAWLVLGHRIVLARREEPPRPDPVDRA